MTIAAMINAGNNYDSITLTPGESVDTVLAESGKYHDDLSSVRKGLVLTNFRLIRLSNHGNAVQVESVLLADIKSAVIKRMLIGKRRFLRIVLLLTGSLAAIVSAEFIPLALPISIVLGLSGIYHTYLYLGIPEKSEIVFRSVDFELNMYLKKSHSEQAMEFANRFFQLKQQYVLMASSMGNTDNSDFRMPKTVQLVLKQAYGNDVDLTQDKFKSIRNQSQARQFVLDNT